MTLRFAKQAERATGETTRPLREDVKLKLNGHAIPIGDLVHRPPFGPPPEDTRARCCVFAGPGRAAIDTGRTFYERWRAWPDRRVALSYDEVAGRWFARERIVLDTA